MTNLEGAVARARDHAPYLAHLIERHPGVVEALANTPPGDVIAQAILPFAQQPVADRLRAEKGVVGLVTALADLAGLWRLEDVTGALSRFADRALDEAIATALAERYPDDEARGFAAIALGKQGSFELNYSSDLDPIFLYDPQTLPRRAREDVAEAAVRLGRRVLEIMQARTGGGYVFRVDLRLRPNPEATPIVLPVDAAISYYESAALPWERAAFIRARACAGDAALGRYFMDALRPFVWRRALDFTAIRETRAISVRVRDHYAQGQKLGPGFDIKRGRGGIREVEFFAQIHQMIFGGRDPALRAPATLDALAALAGAGHIDAAVAADLSAAYRLYRTVEHRLQMVDDRQTHRLPEDPAALDNVARLDGRADGLELVATLAGPVARVGAVYDLLTVDDTPAVEATGEALPTLLDRLDFDEEMRARVTRWRSYEARALRTTVARDAFEAILPGLLEAVAATPGPAETMARLDRFLERLPSGVQFFELLRANPALIALFARLLGFAPSLAEALAARPVLIDGLLDASAYAPVPDVDALADEMRQGLRDDAPVETVLDAVRWRVAERRFALGVQMIEAMTDPLEIAAAHARLAEAALHVVADAVSRDFAVRHGRVPGGRLLVLGLGRLGGGALTAASDLDLIYLFSGDFMGESDGAKPLAATLYFNRLVQRISAGLSAPTAQGPLYEVDTRLRPSGNQGLIAVSIDSFAKYEREDAWTWEHMALARARVVHGAAQDRDEVAAIIDEILRRARESAQLRADVRKMRADIRDHKPPAGPLDVKLIAGGLIDLEFVIHYHQLLSGAGLSPFLAEAIAGLAQAGHLPAELGQAHDLMTRLLVTLRLIAPGVAEEEQLSEWVRALVATACGFDDWPALMAGYAQALALVSALWQQIANEGDDAQ